MNLFHLHPIKNIRIRYQLLLIYSSTFVVIMALSSIIIYSIVKSTVERHIESELKNSTAAILNSVRTAVSVSIKNHMRATAENNYKIVKRLDQRYRGGEISLTEAKHRAEDIIMCQTVGKTGYLCILDGKGRVLKHPKKSLEGLDISDHDFVRQMIERKNGYIEYHWQNPDETKPKAKALYISYFEPWDWLITVSSYRDEFEELVNISDFKESILSHRFGDTGYSYVMDWKGNIIIHPELEGRNVFKDEGLSDFFYQKMIEQRNGKLIYYWKNPSDDHFRKKLVIFNELPEYEWMVASSSYLDEFRMPLNTIRKMIIIISVASLILFLPVTFILSATITRPLQKLMAHFDKGVGDEFSHRLILNPPQRDEIGQLASFYNVFMEKLERYHHSLREEIQMRKKAQDALKLSEERHRSVMEAVPDPVVVYDMEGRVSYMNPAFSKVFGYTLEESVGHKMDHFVPKEHWTESMGGIEKILRGENLPPMESRRKTKEGRLIDVSIRGSVYRDRHGKPVGSVICLRDISEVKHLEKSIMEIGERERQKVGNDLHDDLCPHLIGIEGLVKVMKQKMTSRHGDGNRNGEGNKNEMSADPAPALLADQIIHLIKEGITKTRRLARGLCPVYFTHGLQSSLRELMLNTLSLYDIECTLTCRGDVDLHHRLVVMNLYHIAGEAVQNAIRHGNARNIEILLEPDDDNICLSISDDGKGFDITKQNDGMGIRIMTYRAKLLGGAFSIQPLDSGGTAVVVELPRDFEPEGEPRWEKIR